MPVGSRPQPRWFDSHCHVPMLDAEERHVLDRARSAGVDRMVCVGCDLESSRAAVDLARRQPEVEATVGLHPHEAQWLETQWDALEALAREAPIVAIGEAGFDFYYAHSPFDAQELAFRHQIRLAHELDLALVIHSRDAWDDTFRVLEEEGLPRRTVFHCFTGGPDEAHRAIELGASCSFSGIVSFRNARDVQAAAAIVPDDRLLVETDAPYLAPVPHRGSMNEPAFVVEVGRALAAARDTDVESIAALTRANAEAIFARP